MKKKEIWTSEFLNHSDMASYCRHYNIGPEKIVKIYESKTGNIVLVYWVYEL